LGSWDDGRLAKNAGRPGRKKFSSLIQ
jgi:hypothetical protein